MMCGNWLLVSDEGDVLRFWFRWRQERALAYLNHKSHRWARHYGSAR